MSEQILHPEVPYVGEVEGGLISGKMVRVRGQVPADSAFFAINYQLGPALNPRDDIALHVSPRFNEGVIVRNHIQSMTWGPEESEGPMLIERGISFEIIILCEIQCYKIAINERHFAEFIHRLPYSKVTHLVIDGDVEINSISYEIVNAIVKPIAPILDATIEAGPPAPGGLYPTLNQQDKQKQPQLSDNFPRDDTYQSKSLKPDEKVPPSGIDKIGLVVGGLVAAGNVAAAVHAHKKKQKQMNEVKPEGDHQKTKASKNKSGLGGLGTLGAVLVTSLAANASQRDRKSYAQQGYPSPYARSDVLSSKLGALGRGGERPQSNLLGEALTSGILGSGGHHQQFLYKSSGAFGGFPQRQDAQGSSGTDLGNDLSGVLLKSAVDGFASHVSQQVEKKLAKQLNKTLKLNSTPRKA